MGEQVGVDVDYQEDGRRVANPNAFGPQRGLVVDLLVQINVLFEDFRKDQLFYHRLQEVDFDTSTELDEVIKSASDGEEVSTKKRDLLADGLRTLSSRSKAGWKRLQWAGWDKKEFEKLIQRFSDLNERITGLLDIEMQKEIAKATQDTRRMMIQMTTKLDQFERLIHATQFAQDSSSSLGHGMKTMMDLAQFKFYHNFIEGKAEVADDRLQAASPRGQKIEKKNLKIAINKIKVLNGGDASRTLAAYPIEEASLGIKASRFRPNVWIEWKKYDSTPNQAGPPSDVLDRAKKLSNLLNRPDKPAEFRVPHCLGYFDNKEYLEAHKDETAGHGQGRIGYVFEPPHAADVDRPPKSLLQILQPRTGVVKPTVTARIALAHALASSLMFLHTVDWLHKGLRSDNVLLFDTPSGDKINYTLKTVEPGEDESIDYGNPILSGFDYARPANKSEHTEAPDTDIEAKMYRHPESQKTSGRPNYVKTFDIYSLGVVLVELAFWMPIDEVVAKYDRLQYQQENPDWDERDPTQAPKNGVIFDKDYARQRPIRAIAIREKLLKRAAIRGVGSEMGGVYQEVTRRCLEGERSLGVLPGEDETKATVGARLGNTYYEKVVRKLEGIRI